MLTAQLLNVPAYFNKNKLANSYLVIRNSRSSYFTSFVLSLFQYICCTTWLHRLDNNLQETEPLTYVIRILCQCGC